MSRSTHTSPWEARSDNPASSHNSRNMFVSSHLLPGFSTSPVPQNSSASPSPIGPSEYCHPNVTQPFGRDSPTTQQNSMAAYAPTNYQQHFEAIMSSTPDVQLPQSLQQSDERAPLQYDLPDPSVSASTSYAFTPSYTLAFPSSDNFQYASHHSNQDPSEEKIDSPTVVDSMSHIGQVFSVGTATAGIISSFLPPSHTTQHQPEPRKPTAFAGAGSSGSSSHQGSSSASSGDKRKREELTAGSDHEAAAETKRQRISAADRQREHRENINGSLANLNNLLPEKDRSKSKKPNHNVIDKVIPYVRNLKRELSEMTEEHRKEVRGRRLDKRNHVAELQLAYAREQEVKAEANRYKEQLMGVLQMKGVNVQIHAPYLAM